MCCLPHNNGFPSTSNKFIFLRRIYLFTDVLQFRCSKNFRTFHKKTLALESFYTKLQAFSPATLWKRDSNTRVFVWNFKKNLMTSFLQDTSGGCFWELAYMKTQNILRAVFFYGVVGIIHIEHIFVISKYLKNWSITPDQSLCYKTKT